MPAQASFEAELAKEIAVLRRARRRALGRSLGFSVILATLLLGVVRHGEALDAWMRGETDWAGHVVYRPEHPFLRTAFDRVDLERVHRELLPRWAYRVSAARTGFERRRARRTFDELRAAVEPDRNLEAIVSELDTLLRDGAANDALRVDYLFWAWNDYLHQAGAPYRVEATLVVRDGRARVVPRTYRVLSETANEHGASVHVMRRLDHTRVVEPWLGRTAREEDGAGIPIGRVLHFTVREVWPVLDPLLDHLADERVRGVLDGMRAEVEREMDPASFATLVETAEDVRALQLAAASIETRRGCGATFQVFDLPYRGLSPHSIAMIELALAESEGRPCPDLTMDEATQIVAASERLARTTGLEAAIEQLTTLVARSVAAHELRHVEDGPSRRLACPGCVDGMPPAVSAEISAYLAAFADERTGYLSAFQACARPEVEFGLATVAAETAIGAVIPGGCTERAPEDLHARARAAERRFFGERAIASVPAEFPSSLRLFGTRAEMGLAARGD